MDELYSPAIQKALATMKCRIMPTSFEADDPALAGFPLPSDWRWTSCEHALLQFKPHGVMMRLPLFWQLEVPLYYACHSVGAPIFLNDPANMPVGAAALVRGGIDTVVTEKNDAEAFASYLREKSSPPPRNWLIIHRASDTWSNVEIPGDPLVAHEVHLLPGMAILYQCTDLMTENHHHPRFHAVSDLIFDLAAGTVRTSANQDIPSFILPIPRLAAADTCTCGEIIYSQSV